MNNIENGIKDVEEVATSLKEEFGDIVDQSYELITNANFTQHAGAYISSTGQIKSGSAYVYYTLVVPRECELYVDTYTTTGLFQIVIFNGSAIVQGDVSAVYSQASSNLPTSNNPIHISADQMLTISVSGNVSFNLYENGHFYGVSLSNNVLLNTKQLEQAQNRICVNTDGDNGLYIYLPSKDGNNNKYLRFQFTLQTDNTINLNQYRFTSLYVVDSEMNPVHVLSTDIEWEGVVRLNGETDYISGQHGDETNVSLSILADGIPIAIADINTPTFFTEIEITVVSTVNAQDDASNVCFDRFKQIIFNADGLTINNKWRAKKAVDIAVAYMTMCSLPIVRDNINCAKYCRNNLWYLVQQTDGTTLENSPFNWQNCDEIEMWGDMLYVKTRGSVDFDGNTSINGSVQTGQYNIAKTYFRTAGTLQAGKYLKGTSNYKFYIHE